MIKFEFLDTTCFGCDPKGTTRMLLAVFTDGGEFVAFECNKCGRQVINPDPGSVRMAKRMLEIRQQFPS